MCKKIFFLIKFVFSVIFVDQDNQKNSSHLNSRQAGVVLLEATYPDPYSGKK